jgi:ABC-2 type transport system ATP-binding protein
MTVYPIETMEPSSFPVADLSALPSWPRLNRSAPTADNGTVLSLQAVGKRYERRGPWVVRDVTAEVPDGAVIRVEGRNGSGKSTLLRVLAGVTRPSRGRVENRLRTAYVPERFHAGLPFTARGYLTHLGRIQGLSGPDLDRSVARWSERLGLTPFALTPLRSLSKGTAQKVALVQGFMADPGLLVLDEAATGLDRAARVELRAAVAERRAQGRITVFVDHDPEAMAGLVTGRWLVDGSRVEATGPPTPAGGGALRGTVVIEVTGSGASALAGETGVVGARSLEDGATELRVDATLSDELLRNILNPSRRLHVRVVREDGPP